jgi:hypothetical protein
MDHLGEGTFNMYGMPSTPNSHIDLQAISKQVMTQYGFQPDFPPEIAQQLTQIKADPPQLIPGPDIRDLRSLLWSSIDNDTSRDLDQIEYAERTPDGQIKIRPQRFTYRQTCRPRDDHRLHGSKNFSDAARRTLHGRDIATARRRQARHGHRVHRRREWKR